MTVVTRLCQKTDRCGGNNDISKPGKDHFRCMVVKLILHGSQTCLPAQCTLNNYTHSKHNSNTFEFEHKRTQGFCHALMLPQCVTVTFKVYLLKFNIFPLYYFYSAIFFYQMLFFLRNYFVIQL